MLGKNKVKFINSLKIKKYRDQSDVFVAEGTKLVLDLVKENLELKDLYCSEEWYEKHANQIEKSSITVCSDAEINKISVLQTSSSVVAIFGKPDFGRIQPVSPDELVLFLNSVQDPGNMGTIIRTADWYGVKKIFCDKTCADIFNLKVIQSSMGAIGRIAIYNVDEEFFFNEIACAVPVYGTFLDGDDMYKTSLTNGGVIVMGNEGAGISKEIEKFVTSKIYIPHFPIGRKSSESLNVAISAGIVMAEFRRRAF